jgi:hypothetical protein
VDLEPIKPVCDKKSRIMGLHSYDRWSTLISSDMVKVGDHFLVGNQLIKLEDLSNIEQGFNSREYSSIKTFGSFICGITNTKELQLFGLSKLGLLEKSGITRLIKASLKFTGRDL